MLEESPVSRIPPRGLTATDPDVVFHVLAVLTATVPDIFSTLDLVLNEFPVSRNTSLVLTATYPDVVFHLPAVRILPVIRKLKRPIIIPSLCELNEGLAEV